tara:strand:+ start:375 stop:542 length:168 start_codon:yes stop_codon:yes gene_type:complete
MLPIINGEKIINKVINNINISIIFSFLNNYFLLLRHNKMSASSDFVYDLLVLQFI